MRILAFAKRNIKEILRDPLNLFFGVGFPLVLLALLSAMQANIPLPLFEIGSLAPGVTVFGFSFITLFSATMISKDRSSAFLWRLYTTPMTSADFILGYTLPLLPISLLQSAVCYGVALLLGLVPSVNILYALLSGLPVSLLYISLGLLCGSILNEKQVGGVCGALLTNLSAWLSGIWFDLALLGKTFEKIARLLPFFHAVELQRAVINGSFEEVLSHLLWVFLYDALLLFAAVLLFLKQMKRQ